LHKRIVNEDTQQRSSSRSKTTTKRFGFEDGDEGSSKIPTKKKGTATKKKGTATKKKGTATKKKGTKRKRNVTNKGGKGVKPPKTPEQIASLLAYWKQTLISPEDLQDAFPEWVDPAPPEKLSEAEV
jgi:hypothetical protein